MKSLKEQIAKLQAMGYSELLASAKAVHDVVLLAISRSGFKTHGTLKGGCRDECPYERHPARDP